MSPLSHLMRSVTAQATRGGRLVVSRRNFSSSPITKETRKRLFNAVGGLATGFVIGYITLHETASEAKKKELEKVKKKSN